MKAKTSTDWNTYVWKTEQHTVRISYIFLRTLNFNQAPTIEDTLAGGHSCRMFLVNPSYRLYCRELFLELCDNKME